TQAWRRDELLTAHCLLLTAYCFSTVDSDDGACESCKCKARRCPRLRVIQSPHLSYHPPSHQSLHLPRWFRRPSTCHDASARKFCDVDDSAPASSSVHKSS